jgi:prepilin-type N-terminal cleavage/methylation domain-containing protein
VGTVRGFLRGSLYFFYFSFSIGGVVMSRSVSRRGRDPARRSAFTLVELLVVVVIIAMLMGMLFPAFAQVIEAVRRNQCQSKLRDLARTATVYEQINKSFPKSSTKPIENAQPGATDKETAGYSWAVFFLEHYDGQQDLYNRLRVASTDVNKAFTRSPWDQALVDEQGAVGEATGRHFSTYTFDFFNCPSYSSDSVIPNTTEAKEYETIVQDQGSFAVGTMTYVALSATSMSKVDPSRGSGSSSSSSEDQDSKGKARPDGVIIYRPGPGVKKNEIRQVRFPAPAA